MALWSMWLKFSLIVCCAVICSQAKFTWKQCDNYETFLVEHLDVKPYPVKIPGDMVLSLNMSLLRGLNASEFSISIYWKTFIGNIRIPCIFNLGSCTYQNGCTLMDRIIRENWGGFMRSFVSQLKKILVKNDVDLWCPVMPQEVFLHNERLYMPTIPSVLNYFTGGSYLFKVWTDNDGQPEEMFCLDIGDD